MKYLKSFCFFIIPFFLLIIEVNASSAYCAYSNNDTIGIGITINENFKITYANLSKYSGNVTISGLNATLSDFLDSDNNLYCPDVIYYTVTSSGGREVKYAFSFDSSYTAKISLSSSKVENDPSNTNPDDENNSTTNKTLVRECEYGSYNVYYFSDGTYSASGTGSMSNYNVSLSTDNPEILKSYCPENAYVASSGGRGGNYATISFTSSTGLSKVTLTKGYTQSQFQKDNNIEIPKLDIEEIKFCDSGGVLKAFQVLGYILYIVKLVIPLLIVILGSVDFAKAVISSDDKASKEAAISLAKRIVIAVIIFFIPTILDFLLGLVDGASETFNDSGFTKCTDCLLDPLDSSCQAKNIGEE